MASTSVSGVPETPARTRRSTTTSRRRSSRERGSANRRPSWERRADQPFDLRVGEWRDVELGDIGVEVLAEDVEDGLLGVG